MAQLINKRFTIYCLCEVQETKYQMVKLTHYIYKQPELRIYRRDGILENNRS